MSSFWLAGTMTAAFAWASVAGASEAGQLPSAPPVQMTLEEQATSWSVDDLTAKLGAPNELKELGSYKFATYRLLFCPGQSCSDTVSCVYEFRVDTSTSKVSKLTINGIAFVQNPWARAKIMNNIEAVCSTRLEVKIAQSK